MAEKTRAKKQVDWEAVEREYRAGIRSLKSIGDEYGVSDAGILKRAKRDGWERDLGAKIKAKAEALVSADVVSAEVSAQTKAAEREVVEANAEMLAGVIRGQRKQIGTLREVVDALLLQVKATIENCDLFEKVGELCYAPDEDGVDKLNELYRKVIALPSQIDGVKKLAEALRILIELERKVFKLDDGVDPVESAARGAAQGAAEGAAKTADQMAKLRELIEKEKAA